MIIYVKPNGTFIILSIPDNSRKDTSLKKGNANVNFSKPIAENVLGHNSAICDATDPIFWEVCPLGGYFWKT